MHIGVHNGGPGVHNGISRNIKNTTVLWPRAFESHRQASRLIESRRVKLSWIQPLVDGNHVCFYAFDLAGSIGADVIRTIYRSCCSF